MAEVLVCMLTYCLSITFTVGEVLCRMGTQWNSPSLYGEGSALCIGTK